MLLAWLFDTERKKVKKLQIEEKYEENASCYSLFIGGTRSNGKAVLHQKVVINKCAEIATQLRITRQPQSKHFSKVSHIDQLVQSSR